MTINSLLDSGVDGCMLVSVDGGNFELCCDIMISIIVVFLLLDIH